MSEAQWDDNDSELLLENHNLLKENTPQFFNSARPNLEGFKVNLDRLKTDLEQRRRVDKLDLKKNLEQFESFGQEVEQFTAGVNLEIQQLKLSYEEALQQQFQAQHEKLLELSRLMSEAGDWETLLNNTVNGVQHLSLAERVLIYRFNSARTGIVLAEAVERGWTPAVGETLDATAFGADLSTEYLQQSRVIIDHVSNDSVTPYQLQLLDKFQVQSSLSLCLPVSGKAWGLLVLQQCLVQTNQDRSVPSWTPQQINSFQTIATELSLHLTTHELRTQLQQQQAREATVAKVINKIRRSLDIKTIFQTTTQEVRQLLNTDRAVIYRFNPDWSGEFVAESVAGGWISLLQSQTHSPTLRADISACSIQQLATQPINQVDTYLQETQGGSYSRGETYRVVEDIYNQEFTPCYLQVLESYQVRAYVIVAIYQNEKLWGLLATYQNSDLRQWQESEVSWMLEIAAELEVALQHSELLEAQRLKSEELHQAAERERVLTKVTDKIQQSQDLRTIFNVTTNEVRKLLGVDRVTIYRFNSDWSGSFVAESVASGWSSLIQEQTNNPLINKNISECIVKTVAGNTPEQFSQQAPTIRDTYLQTIQGNLSSQDKPFWVVSDIYEGDFSSCYIEQLERYQARAYTIVPIFQGDKLWGLLAAYQNSEPRDWQGEEINWMVQIAAQISIPLQRAEYLEQLRTQSQKLAELASQEKEARELFQQRAIDLLTAVRPALDGDLTVRAPITNDELGTIADAYNNTIQSLREIVIQVLSASVKVAETATQSEAAITKVSQEAQHQCQELTQGIDQIQSMVNSTQAVTASAQSIDRAVQEANQKVASGETAMNRTVEGILGIRDSVEEASHQIRQLSQYSQNVDRVLNLISDFATQTQLLSLNAALEATRAGEYGKGFAVVADEVRSLARQSAKATTEISNLVAEIRTQTREVIKVTEVAIAQVNTGTELVEESKGNLNAIASATGEISQLVAGITQATLAQLEQSQSVTQTMKEVATISTNTSEDSTELWESFKESLTTIKNLQAAVERFTVN
ncbi:MULTISPECIES: GAF domain-containing protein [Moorena]|uniref:Methyl-accepting chemotaxis protein n=1 Tax=Moorena producens 3L TaxID=489825 RepID=F4XWC2_9CYAN|nr:MULTISPECIES: GAF domain-containing protein [Moorena]EGJ31107.1 methyl-accepting chemotaxis protein [Moorena producens 3L]NEP35258.1 GAF domain-containing protein [Moorena sp. SIO3B2]NEP67967.1 GAF domain-containing protein [Moorena sp. SIO3A5]NER90096.1 GAF domain-containing protein [Moorena sp. SIO3A2]